MLLGLLVKKVDTVNFEDNIINFLFEASFQSQSIVGEDSDEDSDKEKDFSNL